MISFLKLFLRPKPRPPTYTKVQSGQCPTAVMLGWEEEQRNPYWVCDQTGELYKRIANGTMVHVPTKSWSEFMKGKS